MKRDKATMVLSLRRLGRLAEKVRIAQRECDNEAFRVKVAAAAHEKRFGPRATYIAG